MPFVASKLPVVEEEIPEGKDEFPGPQLAGLVSWTFASSEVRLLVIYDGLGDMSTEKVLPPDGDLVLGSAEQWVISRSSMWDAWLMKPLDEALGDELSNRLCGIASVVEVIQVNGEKTSLQCMAIGMWTSKDMCVLFLNCAAVWAPMVFQIVVAVYFMTGWEPAV